MEIARVVCCQGTIQLAVAINSLMLREARIKKDGVRFKNILIVHDLFAPAGQDAAFFEAIRKMASAFLQWETMIFLNEASINRLENIMIEKGRTPFKKEFNAITGAEEA